MKWKLYKESENNYIMMANEHRDAACSEIMKAIDFIEYQLEQSPESPKSEKYENAIKKLNKAYMMVHDCMKV